MALRPQQSTIGPMTLSRAQALGDMGGQRVNNLQNQLLNREAAQQDIDLNQQLNPLLVTAQQQANQIRGNTIDEAEEQRVTQSIAQGYLDIKPFISDANPDLNRAKTLLTNRAQQIQARGGDPSDTLEAIQMIDQGRTQELMDLGETAVRRAQEFDGNEQTVQSSKILDDGTTVQVMRGGGVRVVDAQGNQITGDAAAQKVREAQEFGAELQGERAGQRRTGTLEADIDLGGQAEGTKDAAKQAIKLSGEAFERLPAIRESISNIDEAVRLIDEGAGTGAIESRLPSVKEASVKLDNLQGRMGLNVIQNTTFGALSGPELRFALDTALPKGLEGPALKEWLQDKKEAQQKLSAYLENAAEYLGRPGNTVAGFLEMQRNQRGAIRQPEDQSAMSPDAADAFINSIIGQ